jgi:AhpD family alkylhydroperoxidase
MPFIKPVTIETADSATAEKLNAVKMKVGRVPNVVATIAHSPVALNLYLASSEALGKGRLNQRQREIIALTIAQSNQCQYCLSAHTVIGKGAGLSDVDIKEARLGSLVDGFENGIANLAKKLVHQKGFLTKEDLDEAALAGIDHPLVIEIIANLVHNTLTNYTNHVAQTEIDFPKVEVAI